MQCMKSDGVQFMAKASAELLGFELDYQLVHF